MNEASYKSFDYKQMAVKEEHLSYCIDCYKSFGWTLDENRPMRTEREQCLIWLKRDKQIANKMELTRLERNFEACAAELTELERGKYLRPTIQATICGLIGTVFLAGSVFAVTAQPPIIWLCALLAVPGFAGWILPLFLYRRGVAKRTAQLTPFLERKREEMDELCRKGYGLL